MTKPLGGTRRQKAVGPNPARYHANRGSLAVEREDYDEAARQYRFALAADPGSAEAHHGLGLALLETCRHEAAEVSLCEAIRLKPSQAASWVALARLQSERGDFDASCRSARTALTLRPKLADAYVHLGNILKGRLPDEELREMQRLLDQKYLDPCVRARLHFSLAAVLDTRGAHAEAAALLAVANPLQSAAWAARGRTYDPDQYSRFIDRVIAAFAPEVFARRPHWGDPDPRPVFIVGLPRSGTTLTEQILASHPEVHGAGELPDVHRIFHGLAEVIGRPSDDPFAAFQVLGRPASQVSARRYLDRLDALAPSTAARVVDKMPDNIHFLGLIALLWPGARVIVCSRDVRDLAVSCWQTGFATIRWANDPDHIARRLLDYRRVVEHWRGSLPLTWLDVSYEELVHDLDGRARRLIDFLGLEWDPACLTFHTTRRVVRTASLTEVRQPIHGRSVGRWRRYQAILPQLFQALERHGIGIASSVFVSSGGPEG
jgi:hypothetical protein